MVVSTCNGRKSSLQGKVEEREFKSDKHPLGACSVVSGVCVCLDCVRVFVNVCVSLCIPPDLTTERSHKHPLPGPSYSSSHPACRSVWEQPGAKTNFFLSTGQMASSQ